MKNLWTGIHVEGFLTSTLTELRKRRNQNSFFFFFFYNPFSMCYLEFQGMASRDTLEWVQQTGFGLSLLTLLPTGVGCNPDFEEVRNKTCF